MLQIPLAIYYSALFKNTAYTGLLFQFLLKKGTWSHEP